MTPSVDAADGEGAAPGPQSAPGPRPTSIETWLELSVSADLEAVEAVSEIIGRVAHGGTSVEPGFGLVDEGLGAEIDPAIPAVVRGYLPGADEAAAREAVAATARALDHLSAFGLRPIGELRTRSIRTADWAEAWKAHFPVLRVGRIVIRPTWLRHRRRPGDVVLALDPGMAFGTGLHPTTRLCLAHLVALADRGTLDGARVLDVGCGSGILAIAAARLGAGQVLGVDTDPIAVEATVANVRRNRLARRVTARAGSTPTNGPPFDVVVANLIASVLIDVAPALAGELRPDGLLVASGIFVDRETDVASAYRAAGFEVEARNADGDWVALELRRRA